VADSKHINELIASRRALLGGMASIPLLSLVGAAPAAAQSRTGAAPAASVNFAPVAATNADTVSLPAGYRWTRLVSWGDALFDTVAPDLDLNAMTRAEQEQRFGQNNDMLALFPAQYAFPPATNQDRLVLCANNEYVSPELTFPALTSPNDFTAEQVEALYASVGVSIVEIERADGAWRMLRSRAPGQGRNRRITPFSPVVFSGPAAGHPWIARAGAVVNAAEPDRTNGAAPANAIRCGTGANCAGGYTPWGTYLTAEENFDGLFLGSPTAEAVRAAQADDDYALDSSSFGYPGYALFGRRLAPRQFQIAENPYGPSLYGWIVEIDPYDPASTPKKRTALGRKKNECATTALARNGRVVVYNGDDQRDEHVYKFVTRARFNPNDRAANMDLLDEGQLYAARFDEDGGGRWLPITLRAANAAAEAEGSPIRFRDEADLLMRARDAARLLGATKMDRPEDIEALRDDNWRGQGPVLIVCTNNSERGFEHPGNPRRESENPYTAQNNLPGHIIRIDEAGGDSAATRFTWGVFALAGDPNADELVHTTRAGTQAHVSTKIGGQTTFTGDRFACPDNMFIDSSHRVWIATDGNDSVFGDCNDGVLVAPADARGSKLVKRFLVGPVGAEICGPLMAPDEHAFFCAIQHPGGNDVAGVDFGLGRWTGAPPPSNFPHGGEAWPRSSVVVITREDGGRIGD
jgi:hypothetical protein